jgi:hypothetical protein
MSFCWRNALMTEEMHLMQNASFARLAFGGHMMKIANNSY